MLQMRHITFQWIKEYEPQLMDFAKIDEKHIQDLWIDKAAREPHLNSFKDLKYSCQAPLYQKMIFRFWNEKKAATGLYQGCDPCNQKKLLASFDLPWEDTHELIEFLGSISTGLGTYDIVELDGIEFSQKENSKLLSTWQSKTSDVAFFFSLTKELQEKLIDKYNKGVDAYNKQMQKGF